MSYRIEDEPVPTALSDWVVNPIWPLFALFFAGPWLAFPWFAFNAVAVGSPKRNQDVALAVLSLLVAFVGFYVLVGLLETGVITKAAIPYILIVLTTVKLGLGYVLLIRQQRAVTLYEYFGGVTRNGFLVVVAGAFIKPRVQEIELLFPLVIT